MWGLETERGKFEVLGYPKCIHKECRPGQDKLTRADPHIVERTIHNVHTHF